VRFSRFQMTNMAAGVQGVANATVRKLAEMIRSAPRGLEHWNNLSQQQVVLQRQFARASSLERVIARHDNKSLIPGFYDWVIEALVQVDYGIAALRRVASEASSTSGAAFQAYWQHELALLTSQFDLVVNVIRKHVGDAMSTSP
jgi:hypothetical protein